MLTLVIVIFSRTYPINILRIHEQLAPTDTTVGRCLPRLGTYDSMQFTSSCFSCFL